MIWVVGGTSDCKIIIKKLLDLDLKVLCTTATEYGKKIIDSQKNLTVIAKPLNKEEMKNIINDYNIKIIIDTTHPFAEEVTRNVVIVAQELNTKYIRFERKSVDFDFARYFDSYKDIVEYLKNKEGNIFLTIGVKNLFEFVCVEKNRLFVRVLSKKESLEQCEKLGLLPENVISLKGVCSKELNKALLNEFKIKYLVTKDSGEQGGLIEKIYAAKELDIEVLILKRPFLR